MTPRTRPTVRLFALVLLAGLPIGGCTSPLAEQTERDLRRSVIDSVRRELAPSDADRDPIQTTREPGLERLNLPQRAMPELETMGGPASYDARSIAVGQDLHGRDTRTVAIGLQRAIRSAVERNLGVQFARIGPAVAEAEVVAAEAAFDWTFFSTNNYANTDEPRTRTLSGGFPSGNRSFQEQNITSTTGIRRQLATGGQFTLQQEWVYADNQSIDGGGQVPNPANALGVAAQFDQPLLRNFGSDVSQAQIRINRNAERGRVAELKRDLIRTVTETERTYWQLVQAHRDLLILERLLQRGEQVRDQLRQREKLDATPAQIADAVARVESRRADVMRAQNALRNRSDALKAIVNDPELTVGSETLLLPSDLAIDEPVRFSLFDAINDAMSNRPEIQQAILSIDDTSIRQVVADRARLPQLDLRLQTEFNALNDSAGGAYEDVFDGDFVNYLVGLVFEQPIGNRRAEADLRRRRLERMQAVVSYRNTVQQIVLELKTALNNVATNYRLIEQTKAARFAAAEVLRALLVEKETIGRYTVERLDLEFNRQEGLANAEREEIRALTEYNIAIAEWTAAQGTTLERNGIAFVVPTAEEALRGQRNGIVAPPEPIEPAASGEPAPTPAP